MASAPIAADRAGGEGVMAEQWILASADEIPHDWYAPELKNYRVICSGGFDGVYGLSSAFLHNPRDFPQCYGDADTAICTIEIVKRVSSEHPTSKAGETR